LPIEVPLLPQNSGIGHKSRGFWTHNGPTGLSVIASLPVSYPVMAESVNFRGHLLQERRTKPVSR